MSIDTAEFQGVRFEEGYMFKNNRTITSTSDVAITELVANAWDAGAYNVRIKIPYELGEKISIEDDGIGMSDQEFREKWMTLNYDRQKREGKKVIFPPGVQEYKRIAYGKNGIGRHGMLCFSNSYTVETWKNGICMKYEMAVSHGKDPFVITNQSSYSKEGHGTLISTYLNRNLPLAEDMIHIISARFLYDPNFLVNINGKTVDLSNHTGIYEKTEIEFTNGIKIKLTIIDSAKTANKSQQHGIAFWVCGRLVGKPSWSYGKYQFLDGRFKAAKRYTLVVETNDLLEYVLPDWTGFYDISDMNEVYKEFKEYVDQFISTIMADQVSDLQMLVIENTRDDLEPLPLYEKREVSNFIEEVTAKNPTISPDFVKTAVKAMVSIEKAKKGEQLLMQLSQMSPDQIDKLNDILSNWDVEDVLSVLYEIDKRIIVVEAISKLCDDNTTDELHTLHPLVLNARWLFGSEFDSPMFISNKALSSVVKILFKDEEYDIDAMNNPRKRPDIVCLKEYSIKAVCTDRKDMQANGVMKPDQILLIELKRGGYEINAKEVSQAENYVRQIKKSGALHSAASIHAFVVGTSIGDVDSHKETSSGIIDVVTYGQLVETADTNLFRLRKQLNEHYESMGKQSIVEKALGRTQIKMDSQL